MKRTAYSLIISLLVAASAVAQTEDCRLMHHVEKKETIYGIARKYDVMEDEIMAANPILKTKGLKKGTYICIPFSAKQKEEAARIEKEKREAEEKIVKVEAKPLKVAVILPFALDQQSRSQESLRMIDFYEGMLLVVDSLKKTGVSVDMVTLDEGNSEKSRIQDVIKNENLKNVDLIIGPGRNENVDALASFAQDHKIPLVIPFSNKKYLTNSRSFLFQVNVQQSEHYNKVISRFVSQHKADNIIFVNIKDKGENPEFIIAFKKALEASGIKYKRLTLEEKGAESLKNIMSTTENNVFIPSTSSSYGYDMLCGSLNDLKKEEVEYGISLFGYPEWQSFATRNHKNMSQFKASFFTGHYHNFVGTRTYNFCSQFEKEFNHEQVKGFPSYGEMGHDIAGFFLTGLQNYGNSFIQNADRHKYVSLHTPLRFVKNGEQGGYTNAAYYNISYNVDGNILLIEY